MKNTDISQLFGVPFGAQADSTTIATIPATKTAIGRASMALGFPKENFQPLDNGGQPVSGADINGILNTLARSAQAAELGVLHPFSAAYAEAIGGYPSGATVAHPAIAGRFLICTQDGNTNDPSQNMAGWNDPLGSGATQKALADETQRAQNAETALQTGYRLINRQVWATGGSYTYTPTAGTRAIIVRLCGGGGGGSGGSGAGPGWLIDGFGGNGGTTAESDIITVPSAPVAVTVGSGGAGTNGGSGGNGGVSSFGSLISCPGGPGGRGAVVFPAGAISGAPGGFTPPAAGNFLWQSLGGQGTPFCSYQGMNCGSSGGSSFFGSGAAWTGDGIAGAAGKNPGSGGSAGTINQTTAPVLGGNGADGIVIVEEYC